MGTKVYIRNWSYNCMARYNYNGAKVWYIKGDTYGLSENLKQNWKHG
jgi:hypothetical protein